jgi:hypothetical protein
MKNCKDPACNETKSAPILCKWTFIELSIKSLKIDGRAMDYCSFVIIWQTWAFSKKPYSLWPRNEPYPQKAIHLY